MQRPEIQKFPAAPGPGYEFTDAQNHAMRRLASRMRWAAIIQIVFGAMQLVGNCSVQSGHGTFAMSATSGPFYIVLIVVGAVLLTASKSFQRIVDSQGHDVDHLMAALQSLSRAAKIEIVAFVIVGILMLLAIVAVALVFLFVGSLLHTM